MRFFPFIVVLCFIGYSALSVPRAPRTSGSRQKKVRVRTVAPAAQPRTLPDVGAPVVVEKRDHILRYNSLIGVNVQQSQGAIVSGGQLAYVLGESRRFYIGPEVNFSLFGPGSSLQILVGLAYRWDVFNPPTFHLWTGLLSGTALLDDGVGSGKRGEWAHFAELAFESELNRIVSIRAQLRPGIISGEFTFMTNFNMCFLFGVDT